MPSHERLKCLLTLAPIVGLLGIGFALTLRSGLMELGTSHRFRRLASSLSQIILIVGSCLFGMAFINYLVGQPFHWNVFEFNLAWW